MTWFWVFYPSKWNELRLEVEEFVSSLGISFKKNHEEDSCLLTDNYLVKNIVNNRIHYFVREVRETRSLVCFLYESVFWFIAPVIWFCVVLNWSNQYSLKNIKEIKKIEGILCFRLVVIQGIFCSCLCSPNSENIWSSFCYWWILGRVWEVLAMVVFPSPQGWLFRVPAIGGMCSGWLFSCCIYWWQASFSLFLV